MMYMHKVHSVGLLEQLSMRLFRISALRFTFPLDMRFTLRLMNTLTYTWQWQWPLYAAWQSRGAAEALKFRLSFIYPALP